MGDIHNEPLKAKTNTVFWMCLTQTVQNTVSISNGGVCEPISAPLFMRGEPTHRSFFAAISCDKNRNLCDISAEKRE
jgi:hypothetical protein